MAVTRKAHVSIQSNSKSLYAIAAFLRDLSNSPEEDAHTQAIAREHSIAAQIDAEEWTALSLQTLKGTP